jgi:hypothetical protein
MNVSCAGCVVASVGWPRRTRNGETGPWKAPLLCNAVAPRQPVFLVCPLLKQRSPIPLLALLALLICIKAAALRWQHHE